MFRSIHQKKRPPPLTQCLDVSKYRELKDNIRKSNVSELEKNFLIAAATRHYAFNYSKIADYYASASPEMQKLMEQSALVIIDFDDAIANGYIRLNKRMSSIVDKNLESDKNA